MKQKNETRKEQISELNDLRKEVDRLSRYCRKLEDENTDLAVRLSKYETKPIEETGKISFEKKKLLLNRMCLYGVTHFCDGTPNGIGEYRPPCPDYEYCTIRQKHVYKPKGEE